MPRGLARGLARQVVTGAPISPWRNGRFEPDLEMLNRGLAACAVSPGRWGAQQAGGIGLALDQWAANELRRAGYEADAVWPRVTMPRVLPAAVARAIARLRTSDRSSPIVERIQSVAGSTTATVFGEFFPKKVDVLVADWDRGVELMISTKSMTGSYANNLNNRWEEFVGDLRNIRGRHPLAVLAVLFLADVSITSAGNRASYARLVDMLLKLRSASPSGSSYDATALVIAEAAGRGRVRLVADVPADLQPSQFFEAILRTAFMRLPEAERRAARELLKAAELPTAEASPPPLTHDVTVLIDDGRTPG